MRDERGSIFYGMFLKGLHVLFGELHAGFGSWDRASLFKTLLSNPLVIQGDYPTE